MRCKYEGCPNLTHYPNSAICWKKWSLCAIHARFLHPEEYSNKAHNFRIGERKTCTAENYKTQTKSFMDQLEEDSVKVARKIRRKKVKELFNQGISKEDIAIQLGFSHSTIKKDIIRIKHEQLLSPRAN